jgi:hypothetical protein
MRLVGREGLLGKYVNVKAVETHGRASIYETRTACPVETHGRASFYMTRTACAVETHGRASFYATRTACAVETHGRASFYATRTACAAETHGRASLDMRVGCQRRLRMDTCDARDKEMMRRLVLCMDSG